ncbi:MAG: hypothetical protein UU82_C0037G0004 [Candidatus Nomurabacteria bacterium GW2011_GWC2_41_8]|nr:MAG: hypothetical protein UU58_C0015G0002 [Candidatus Nomurabacteria bacterium GW2011_GWA2_41_25]KKS23228.1 MAG: hypothetical protein UU82_C0037G0004 [Candidatus Nomurabacteria bacterium GW2011_GWC2_41_8]
MQGMVLPNPVAYERQGEGKPVEPVSSLSPSPSLSSFLPSSSPSVSSSPSPIRSFSPSYSPSSSLLRKSSFSEPAPSSHRTSSLLKFLAIFIIIAGLGFGFWFYRSSIINLWTSLFSKISSPSSDLPLNTTSDTETAAPTFPIAVTPPVIETINCGVGTAPKLGNPSTYENDSVLACLGANAINCKNAKGVLQDNFFPTIFEITKSQDSCNFRLSYPADSALIDITGKQLAGQYILCPIDVVKAIDNTKPATPKFNAPNKADFSEYASDVYFYGTLGLFAENNLDMAKIQALGCSGEYIQSVIASYKAKR